MPTSEQIKAFAHADIEQETLPEFLWHYTDAAGLLGIVNKNVLRFTHSKFLNDQTEFTYGWNLINDALDAEIAKSDRLRLFFEMVKSVSNEVTPKNNLFLSSWSERNNSISQWQRYGADGRGYCLGIAASHLERELLDSDAVSFRRMIYDSEAQRELIHRTLERARQKFHSGENAANSRSAKEEYLHLHGAALSFQLSELSLALKNPRFEDEVEWRFIRVIREDDQGYDPTRIKFAVRGEYVKPYIEVKFASDKLPLCNVICGPKLDSDLAVGSARYFLDTQGYSGVPVEVSELRGTWR